MPRPDRFITSCASWSEFWEGTKRLSTAIEKGAVFERLTQLYLQSQNINQSWHTSGLFAKCLRTYANFSRFQPSTKSKFRSQHDKPLTRRELGTFSNLAFNTCSNIELAVVAHTASKPVSKRHLMRNTTEIGLDRWQSLDQDTWRPLMAGVHRGLRRIGQIRT